MLGKPTWVAPATDGSDCVPLSATFKGRCFTACCVSCNVCHLPCCPNAAGQGRPADVGAHAGGGALADSWLVAPFFTCSLHPCACFLHPCACLLHPRAMQQRAC